MVQGRTELSTETGEGGGSSLSPPVSAGPHDTEGTSSPKSMQHVLFPQVSCSSAGTASGQVTRRS